MQLGGSQYVRYQESGRSRVFEIRIYLGGMDLFTDGLCCFVTILGVLLACAARGKPCEAWRPMVTPTDQARSREGAGRRGQEWEFSGAVVTGETRQSYVSSVSMSLCAL